MKSLKESLLDGEDILISNTDGVVEDHFKFYNHFELSWYSLFDKGDTSFTTLFKKADVKKYSKTLPKIPQDFYSGALDTKSGMSMTKARNTYMLHLIHIVGCCEWTGDINKFLNELENILNKISIKKVYVKYDVKKIYLGNGFTITIWEGDWNKAGIVLRFKKKTF